MSLDAGGTSGTAGGGAWLRGVTPEDGEEVVELADDAVLVEVAGQLLHEAAQVAAPRRQDHRDERLVQDQHQRRQATHWHTPRAHVTLAHFFSCKIKPRHKKGAPM